MLLIVITRLRLLRPPPRREDHLRRHPSLAALYQLHPTRSLGQPGLVIPPTSIRAQPPAIPDSPVPRRPTSIPAQPRTRQPNLRTPIRLILGCVLRLHATDQYTAAVLLPLVALFAAALLALAALFAAATLIIAAISLEPPRPLPPYFGNPRLQSLPSQRSSCSLPSLLHPHHPLLFSLTQSLTPLHRLRPFIATRGYRYLSPTTDSLLKPINLGCLEDLMNPSLLMKPVVLLMP